jgi:hypothetical protein
MKRRAPRAACATISDSKEALAAEACRCAFFDAVAALEAVLDAAKVTSGAAFRFPALVFRQLDRSLPFIKDLRARKCQKC